mgnify:CR=1 FL=1
MTMSDNTQKKEKNLEELNVQRILTMMMKRMMTLEMTSKKRKKIVSHFLFYYILEIHLFLLLD